MKKKRVLLALPLPPPYSGQERLTQCLLQSGLEEKFDLNHVDISLKQNNIERGQFNFKNISRSLWINLKLVKNIILIRPDLLNIPLARNKWGFIRYGIMIIISKVFSYF